MNYAPRFVSKQDDDTKHIMLFVEDIKAGSVSCSLQLYGYFIGKSMDYRVVNVNLSRMWRKFGIVSITKTSSEVFYFKFNNEEVEPSTIPIWMCVYNIPIELCNGNGISKIMSGIEKPMLMDKLTKERCLNKSGKPYFSRVLMEASVDEELPHALEIAYPALGDKPARIGILESSINGFLQCVRIVRPLVTLPLLASADQGLRKNCLLRLWFLIMMDKFDGYSYQFKGSQYGNMYNTGNVWQNRGKSGPNAQSKGGVRNRDSHFMPNSKKMCNKYVLVDHSNFKPKVMVRGTHSKCAVDGVCKEDVSVSNSFQALVHHEVNFFYSNCHKYGMDHSFEDDDIASEKGGLADEMRPKMLLLMARKRVNFFYSNCHKYGMDHSFEDDDIASEKGGLADDMRPKMGLNKCPNQKQVIDLLHEGTIIGRRCLWKDLIIYSRVVKKSPWVLLRDFNCILDLGERSTGSSSITHGMAEFRQCLARIEVSNLAMSGQKFTWNKSTGSPSGLLKKLDREAVKDEELLLKRMAKVTWLSEGDANTRHVSKKEIKDAIFGMDNDNAPNLDGFSAKFFKFAWLVIGDEVCNAVLDSFANGKLLKEVNATIIALVPKTQTPRSVAEFRPIACYNILYKCITKIISNRIKVMEAFSLMLKKRLVEDGDFKFHWRCEKVSLTQLCFADDLMIFAKADSHSMSLIRAAFDEFSEASGLKANINKSMVFFCNVPSPLRSSILENFPLPVGSLSNRLKGFIGKLVSDSQSAFIPSRQISDTILLSQELLRNYHRCSGPPKVSFKIDLRKAQCLARIEVSNLAMSGLKFTWNKSPGNPSGLLKKLDRVLSNMGFIERFLNANAQFLISDHTLCILNIPSFIGRKPKQFKFPNFLANKSEFLPIVKSIWDLNIPGYSMFSVVSKLKMLKKPLQKAIFLNAYKDAVKDKELMLKQRAKVTWLSEGYANTRSVSKKEVKDAILVWRMKKLLVDGYSAKFFKSACLVVGDKISDNILLSQELLRNYHRCSGPPKVSFKIDLRKAYDSVEWRVGNGVDISAWFDNWLQIGPLCQLISNRDIFKAGLSLNCRVNDLVGNREWKWPDQ
nr:hypothetical protein [Tanacetum cinerariifolium]